MKILYKNNLYENKNQTIKYISKKYSQLSDNEIKEIFEFIKEGNQVVTSSIIPTLQNSYVIFLALIDDNIAGVSCIKQPSTSYKESIFDKANVPELANNFKFEYGLLYVKSEFRNKGISNALLSLAKNTLKSPLYATTRTDNEGSIKTLLNNGFKIAGKKYKSFRGDYYLNLYIST